jgi:hypothetical protein
MKRKMPTSGVYMIHFSKRKEPQPMQVDPYLNGMVDDFRIYRGPLTAAEVKALATSGIQ